MASYTLGVDIGTNSIGWALVDESNKIIDNVGVRVLPEGSGSSQQPACGACRQAQHTPSRARRSF